MVNMKSRSSRSSLKLANDEQSVASADSGKGSANGSNSGDEPMSPNSTKLKLQRLQRDAARHREKYKNETEEQRKRRRERDALRHKEAYREKRMQKRIERLDAMYINKEHAPAEIGVDSLSPLPLNASNSNPNPPAKRVRSKGRAASVPNFTSVASHLAAFGNYHEAHSRRCSGTVGASSDSEDHRGVYPAFEVLHPFSTQQMHGGHGLASSNASVSSATASGCASASASMSFHVPGLESSTSDLTFAGDGVFADAVFMDGLFESYDYNLLPGIDTIDLLDGIDPHTGHMSHSHGQPTSACTTRNCSSDTRTESNCRSESIDSTCDTPHHMPMPAHIHPSFNPAYAYGRDAREAREEYNGRTTRSNTFPTMPHYAMMSNLSNQSHMSHMSNVPAPYNPALSVHAVDYSLGSMPFVLSQHPHLNALMHAHAAMPPPPAQFVPFNPLPPRGNSSDDESERNN